MQSDRQRRLGLRVRALDARQKEREWRSGMALVRRGGATVYACRRILLYSPREIRLLSENCQVVLLGEGLHCVSFSAGTVAVRGRLSSLSYLPESGTCEGRE